MLVPITASVGKGSCPDVQALPKNTETMAMMKHPLFKRLLHFHQRPAGQCAIELIDTEWQLDIEFVVLTELCV